jgi:hypothetical protein
LVIRPEKALSNGDEGGEEDRDGDVGVQEGQIA